MSKSAKKVWELVHPKNKKAHRPWMGPGCYAIFIDGWCAYVGESQRDVLRRAAQHLAPLFGLPPGHANEGLSLELKKHIASPDSVVVEIYKTSYDMAFIKEMELIGKYIPRFNRETKPLWNGPYHENEIEMLVRGAGEDISWFGDWLQSLSRLDESLSTFYGMKSVMRKGCWLLMREGCIYQRDPDDIEGGGNGMCFVDDRKTRQCNYEECYLLRG